MTTTYVLWKKATPEEIAAPGKTEQLERLKQTHIEQKYLKNKRRVRYTLFEKVKVDWEWDEEDIIRFRKMWTAGYPVDKIAELLPAKPHEVALMIVDGEMTGKIKPRPGGLLGAAHPSQKTEPIPDESFAQKRNHHGIKVGRGPRGSYGKRTKEDSQANG